MHIVTDSTCDLPEEIVRGRDITIVPYRVTIDGETFVERVELEPAEFWQRMAAAKQLPKTAPPTPGDFAEAFTRLAADGEPLLCVTISSDLSATYESALLAKDLSGVDVTVFDTRFASAGLGLFVLRAAELAEAGRSVAEIVADLSAYRDSLKQFNLIFTFENVVKGGRLSPAKGAISTVLGIRAIIDIPDGELVVRQKVRGHRRLLETLLKMIAEERPDLSDRRVVIAHLNNLSDAEYLKSQLIERCGAREVIIAEIGAGIGTYAGDKGIALAF